MLKLEILGFIVFFLFTAQTFGDIVHLPKAEKNTAQEESFFIKNKLFEEIVSKPLINNFFPVGCTYNSIGKITSFSYPNGGIVKFQYDKIGRLVKRIWSDEKSYIQYDYDKNLLKSKEESGRVTSYEYDDCDNIVKIIIRKGEQTLLETRTYDSQGRLLSITENGNSTVCFLYDRFGHKLLEAGSNGSIQYLYNNRGLIAESQIKVNGISKSFNVKYKYDLHDYLRRISYPAGDFIFEWNHKIAKPVRITCYCKDITSSKLQYSYVISNKYNNKKSLVAQSIFTGIGDAKELAVYKYDVNERIISSQIFETTWRYSYDKYNQLIYAENNLGEKYNYAYDAMGNCIRSNEKCLTYNKLNQINSSGYIYDEWGNLITSPTASYKYDLKDRLIEITTAEKTFRYSYDPLGQILSCSVFLNSIKTNNYPVETIKYLMFGMKIYAYVTGSSVQYYIQPPLVSSIVNKTTIPSTILASIDTKNQMTYFLSDLANGIFAKFDVVNNQFYFYKNYSPIIYTSASSIFPFGFKTMLFSNGLLFDNKRFYSPNLGRYLNRNTAFERDGYNIYILENNNSYH